MDGDGAQWGQGQSVQALRDRGTWHGRRWLSPWVLVVAAVLVAGGGAAYAVSQGTHTPVDCSGASCSTTSGGSGPGSNGGTGPGHPGKHPLRVTSTTPVSGTTAVAPDSSLEVVFSSAVDAGGAMPTLSPSVTGSWNVSSGDRLVFTPSEPFVPYEKYTLSIPGGTHGVQSTSGAHLAATRTVSFTIANGSVLRLQQLLAELGYLPVAYTGTAPATKDLATPQPGTFTWRWSDLPAALTSQWVAGTAGAITKAAVMTFETQNGLTVDGVAGPKVWATLLDDFVSHKADSGPLTYVLVTKVEPEHLTAWVNGTLQFHDIPVNTGVPGANTEDGTFQVFEHVRTSDMKGTDVTGTKYTDPDVPWASYFNGGDALHGFPRATYGWPQSNGCVEMRIGTAGALWPYTPIGTLVTVQGPSSGTGPSPPPTTTTTTTAPPTTTTTTTAPTLPAIPAQTPSAG